jgi:hypothetical protein
MIAAYGARVGYDTSALVDEVRAAMCPSYYGFPIFPSGSLCNLFIVGVGVDGWTARKIEIQRDLASNAPSDDLTTFQDLSQQTLTLLHPRPQSVKV